MLEPEYLEEISVFMTQYMSVFMSPSRHPERAADLKFVLTEVSTEEAGLPLSSDQKERLAALTHGKSPTELVATSNQNDPDLADSVIQYRRQVLRAQVEALAPLRSVMTEPQLAKMAKASFGEYFIGNYATAPDDDDE